jgi:glutaredoxin
MAVALVDKDGKKVLRIIDKRTGKVEEGEVVSMENTKEGVKVKTVDKNGHEKEHVIKVDVTTSGAPVLKVDGKDGGVVRTVQTPDRFLFYDPEKGWQLINGVLAPLAEAFKNGIQVSFSGGVGVGKPGSSVVINYPKERGGFSLPFTGELAILLPLGFALLRRVKA